MGFPTNVQTFTTKQDGSGNTINAAHVNDLQTEVVALENAFLNATSRLNAGASTAATLSVLGGSTFAGSISAAGKSTFAGAMNVTGASTLASISVTGGSTFAGTLNVFGASTFTGNANFAGTLTFSGQFRCSAYHSTVQSLADATGTALTFDSEDYDVGSMHSTSVTPTRMIVPTGGDGLYSLTGSATFAADADGIRQIVLRKNGATDLQTTVVAANSAGGATAFQVITTVALVATDYVELIAVHTAGNALSVGSASRVSANSLQMVKLA